MITIFPMIASGTFHLFIKKGRRKNMETREELEY
jgi:hypothetical protein